MPGKTYFIDEEKDLLTELVGKYKHVVENKKTDATSLHAKSGAWDRLCVEYNSMPNVRPREVKQLKKLWDNLKQKWKKEKARHASEVMATGGGPPPEPLYDRLSQIEAILPHIAIRVPNPFDSDALHSMATQASHSSPAVANIIDSMVVGDGRSDHSDDEFVMDSQDDRLSDLMPHSLPAADVTTAELAAEDERLAATGSQEEDAEGAIGASQARWSSRRCRAGFVY